MMTKKSKYLAVAVIMAKAPVFIVGLITLTLMTPLPLLAKKKTPDSQVKLTSPGRKLETDYTRRMKALESELNSSVSKIDKKRKDYYLTALEAYTAAEKNLNNTHNAEGMISKAQGLVNHAKGKWIGGADHQIKRVQAELKNAKGGAARSKAEKELAKWEKNREEGVKELKVRQAMLDKALSDKAHFKKNLGRANKELKEAKEDLDEAGKKTGLDAILQSNKLDAAFAQYVILKDATPRGLAEFAQEDSSHEAAIAKMLADDDLMIKMLVADGAKAKRVGRSSGPAQYGQAMKIYSDIQKISTRSKEGLFQNLALAVSLEHAVPIQQTNPASSENAAATVDPVKRYLHYEEAYLNGELDPCFKNLSIWELRMVVDGQEPDEILAWGRESMRNYRPDHITSSNEGWRYVRIISSDVTYGSGDVKYDLPELHQFQNILMNGGVCGRRAFFGRFILRAFGVPTIARPSRGHAALARYTTRGWAVCLGGGWGAGWTKTLYASDKDFLASTQARKNKESYLAVKRAQWAGDLADEARVYGENDKTKADFWNGLALKTQRGVIASLKVETLEALGANLGEADGNSGVEKGSSSQVTAADKKITYGKNATISIAAAAYNTTGTRGISTMKSFNGGLQVLLPRFSLDGTSLLRGGSWKNDAADCASGWRLPSGGYGAYDNWGFRVALTHDGGNAPREITLKLAGGVTMDFVYIKPGKFKMGGESKTDGKWHCVELPEHSVTITKGYYLGKHEVTQAQFEAVMGYNTSKSSKDPDCPVDRVSWSETLKFCENVSTSSKRKVRLPTEAEWEYAARAGSSEKWFFGSQDSKLKDYAWYQENSGSKTHKVGQKKPNPWGLYDIYGNVVERVADVYEKNYYAKSPKEDPVGPGQAEKTYFEYDITAPKAGNYALTAKVVTNKHSQELAVSVNENSSASAIDLPFTVGDWQDSKPVHLTLKRGKNVLRFARSKPPQNGIAVKSFTLKPASATATLKPASPTVTTTPKDPLHTFTSTNGKKIKASIVSVANDQVKIKREDGKIFTTSISIYIDEDIAYIRGWAE
jgi:formylglycine-generating enzyme required for sulfatase activity